MRRARAAHPPRRARAERLRGYIEEVAPAAGSLRAGKRKRAGRARVSFPVGEGGPTRSGGTDGARREARSAQRTSGSTEPSNLPPSSPARFRLRRTRVPRAPSVTAHSRGATSLSRKGRGRLVNADAALCGSRTLLERRLVPFPATAFARSVPGSEVRARSLRSFRPGDNREWVTPQSAPPHTSAPRTAPGLELARSRSTRSPGAPGRCLRGRSHGGDAPDPARTARLPCRRRPWNALFAPQPLGERH